MGRRHIPIPSNESVRRQDGHAQTRGSWHTSRAGIPRDVAATRHSSPYNNQADERQKEAVGERGRTRDCRRRKTRSKHPSRQTEAYESGEGREGLAGLVRCARDEVPRCALGRTAGRVLGKTAGWVAGRTARRASRGA